MDDTTFEPASAEGLIVIEDKTQTTPNRNRAKPSRSQRKKERKRERQTVNALIPGAKGKQKMGCVIIKEKQKMGEKASEGVVDNFSEEPVNIDRKVIEEDKGKQNLGVGDKLKISFDYSISKLAEGGLFYGTYLSPVGLPVSFIPYKVAEDAFAAWELLHSHDRGNNIVSPMSMIDASVPGFAIYLVVERVYTLDHYFDLKCSEFCKMHADIQDVNKAMWWNHISQAFKNIFRDVIKAMLYLHSQNKCFGNVRNGIYVTTVHGEQGKVIPAANSTEDFLLTDALELKSKMLKIIGLPFGPTDVLHDDNFQLPDTLKRSLLLLSMENANHVDARMLYDIPYLWADNGIKFVYNLLGQFKRNIGFRDMMDFELASVNSSTKGKFSPPWRALLPTTGELWEIYSKTFHHAKYDKEVDIVRYFVAVFEHYGLALFRNNRVALFQNDRGIVETLHTLYPDVHNRLIEAAVKCFAKHKRFRGIEKELLSSAEFSYF